MNGIACEQKIGDILIASRIINENQLHQALKVQAQTGGRLGSILRDMGYVHMDDLLDYLGKQSGFPSMNLYKLEIEPSILNLLPFDKIKSYEVLPIAMTAKSVFLAMTTPNDITARNELEFFLGKSVQPVVVPAFQVAMAISYIEARGGRLDHPLLGSELKKHEQVKYRNVETSTLPQMFQRLVEEDASDLFLTAGAPPSIKKNNELKRLSTSFLTPEEVYNYACQLMSSKQREEFESSNELDFAHNVPELGRFRINVFRQRHSVSIAARHFKDFIPGLDELGLPPWLEEFALKPQGLILITGPTGHGKTTTLAALVDIINTKRKCNIITIEDPIEYRHRHKASNVNQREVGVDTNSFHDGLKHIFRQAPDVIVIGEMRDPESFAIAVHAADTGHLVISTMHSNTATSAIDAIIDVFPPSQQQQIRVQLAENFLLIMNQRLVPAKQQSARVLVYEKLVGSYRTRSMIREGKTHQIRGMLTAEDFESIDSGLARLCREKKIAPETALKYCDSPLTVKSLIGR
jgi:twitching motility protein PilT